MRWYTFITRLIVFSGVVWLTLFYIFDQPRSNASFFVLWLLSFLLVINHLGIFGIAKRSFGSKMGNGLMAGLLYSFISKSIIAAFVLLWARWNFPFSGQQHVILGVCVVVAHLIYEVSYLMRLNNSTN